MKTKAKKADELFGRHLATPAVLIHMIDETLLQLKEFDAQEDGAAQFPTPTEALKDGSRK